MDEYLDACIYDACGVKWLNNFHTGMCNVLSAYSIACENMGVSMSGWRDGTLCPREVGNLETNLVITIVTILVTNLVTTLVTNLVTILVTN